MFEIKTKKMSKMNLWLKNSFAIMMEKLCQGVVWEKAAGSKSVSYSVGRTNGNEIQ